MCTRLFRDPTRVEPNAILEGYGIQRSDLPELARSAKLVHGNSTPSLEEGLEVFEDDGQEWEDLEAVV